MLSGRVVRGRERAMNPRNAYEGVASEIGILQWSEREVEWTCEWK